MGTLFGFVVGYVVGARAGNDGYARLRQAWDDVRNSDEFVNFLQVLRGHTQDTLRTVSDRLAGDGPGAAHSVDDMIAEAQSRLRNRITGGE